MITCLSRRMLRLTPLHIMHVCRFVHAKDVHVFEQARHVFRICHHAPPPPPSPLHMFVCTGEVAAAPRQHACIHTTYIIEHKRKNRILPAHVARTCMGMPSHFAFTKRMLYPKRIYMCVTPRLSYFELIIIHARAGAQRRAPRTCYLTYRNE
jgi:hypothetical protein